MVSELIIYAINSFFFRDSLIIQTNHNETEICLGIDGTMVNDADAQCILKVDEIYGYMFLLYVYTIHNTCNQFWMCL